MKKQKKQLKLTTENYYTPEADREYLSCSQFEDFLTCEAAAVAKYQGRYTPEKSEAFMVGNFFHTFFESREAHEQFIEENADVIMTKGGKLKAGYRKAEEMIRVAESDPVIKNLIDMPGENEKIMTGKLFGHYPWKIRLDKYIPGPPRMIIDWKTVANIWNLEWSEKLREKVSFVENFSYLFRAAVYMEIEKEFTKSENDPGFLLVCLSKQDPPDKEIISLNGRQRLDLELEKIKEHIWHIQQIKDGMVKPRRCGQCAYCRATKKINDIKGYWQLEPGNRPEREEDYAIDVSGQR